jgi:hypothetical protein
MPPKVGRCCLPALLLPVILTPQSGPQISIPEASLHQYEDGPPLPGSHVFVPGDTMFVTARFAGYRKVEKDDRQWMNLAWTVEAFDPEGVPIVESKSGKIDTDLAPQDKDWLPKVRHDFLLPPLADPGEYKVVVTVNDGLAKTSARRELKFPVKAQTVAPSDTLVIRNFRFLRGEADGPGLNPASYRPGDPVSARFAITGYRLAERNRFQVSYGIEVLRASGKSLYSVPEAANEREETFYRKRFLIGSFSLQLTPDISKGEYTVIIRIRDHLGNQEHESRNVFLVE